MSFKVGIEPCITDDLAIDDPGLSRSRGGSAADLPHDLARRHRRLSHRVLPTGGALFGRAQNLTPKQMKTLLTRAGPGTKMICLGNVEQIDTPYLTETTSGLTYAVDRFKAWQHSAHITLRRGERSRLADFASESL